MRARIIPALLLTGYVGGLVWAARAAMAYADAHAHAVALFVIAPFM